jgi:hypothetical protein
MLSDTDAGKRAVIDVEEGEIGEELMHPAGAKAGPVTLVDL